MPRMWHPDLNSSVESPMVMREINTQFRACLVQISDDTSERSPAPISESTTIQISRSEAASDHTRGFQTKHPNGSQLNLDLLDVLEDGAKLTEKILGLGLRYAVNSIKRKLAR